MPGSADGYTVAVRAAPTAVRLGARSVPNRSGTGRSAPHRTVVAGSAAGAGQNGGGRNRRRQHRRRQGGAKAPPFEGEEQQRHRRQCRSAHSGPRRGSGQPKPESLAQRGRWGGRRSAGRRVRRRPGAAPAPAGQDDAVRDDQRHGEGAGNRAAVMGESGRVGRAERGGKAPAGADDAACAGLPALPSVLGGNQGDHGQHLCGNSDVSAEGQERGVRRTNGRVRLGERVSGPGQGAVDTSQQQAGGGPAHVVHKQTGGAEHECRAGQDAKPGEGGHQITARRDSAARGRSPASAKRVSQTRGTEVAAGRRRGPRRRTVGRPGRRRARAPCGGPGG
jgi:hypothetical protein